METRTKLPLKKTFPLLPTNDKQIYCEFIVSIRDVNRSGSGRPI